jgi:hypothetical protein
VAPLALGVNDQKGKRNRTIIHILHAEFSAAHEVRWLELTLFSTAQADSEVQADESIESSISGQNNWANHCKGSSKKSQTSFCQRMGVMLTAEPKLKRYKKYGRSWLRPCKLGTLSWEASTPFDWSKKLQPELTHQGWEDCCETSPLQVPSPFVLLSICSVTPEPRGSGLAMEQREASMAT